MYQDTFLEVNSQSELYDCLAFLGIDGKIHIKPKMDHWIKIEMIVYTKLLKQQRVQITHVCKSPHSQASIALAKDSSAVVFASISLRSWSASSRNRAPLRCITSRSAKSSSSAGRERDADAVAEAEECASFPHDVSVLKPES